MRGIVVPNGAVLSRKQVDELEAAGDAAVAGNSTPVQFTNTGNMPGWQTTMWGALRIEDVAFAAGENTGVDPFLRAG